MLRKNDIVSIEGIVSFDVGQDESVYVQLPGQLQSCVLRPEQVRRAVQLIREWINQLPK